MIKIGDRVLCQFYNTPERKFYGGLWYGEIVQIIKSSDNKKKFYVKNHLEYIHCLQRKEIKKVL